MHLTHHLVHHVHVVHPALHLGNGNSGSHNQNCC
jgi:hypothetical protein